MRDIDPDENSYNRMNDSILEIAARFEAAGEASRAYALRGLVDGWSTHHHRPDVPEEFAADYYAPAHELGLRADFHGFPTRPPARVVCPHCGNDDLREILWQEWIPSTRSIGIYADGKLYVDTSDYKDHCEGADGDELVCMKCCGGAWKVPGEIIEHADPDEIEARLTAGPVTQCGTFEPDEPEADAI